MTHLGKKPYAKNEADLNQKMDVEEKKKEKTKKKKKKKREVEVRFFE